MGGGIFLLFMEHDPDEHVKCAKYKVPAMWVSCDFLLGLKGLKNKMH